MPTEAEHRAQALRNEQFLRGLQSSSTQYADWVVTVAFYAAVHLVEARLAKLGIHSPDHDKRNSYVTILSEFKPVYREYMELYFFSLQSRYGCQFSSWTPSKVETVISKLQQVKQHLNSLS